MVITDGSCIDTSSCVNVTGVGIADLISKSSLSFYPNPAKTTLNIQNNGESLSISIVALTGEIIKTLVIKNGIQQIDISNLNSGLYLMKYSIKNQSFIKKIIIE